MNLFRSNAILLALLLVSSLVGCGHKEGDGHDHGDEAHGRDDGHGHGEE